MKVIIYTCLAGDIDILEDPKVPTPGCEYICFSDRPRNVKVWNVVPLLESFDDPRLTARYHKTIGASMLGCDLSIWQDAKVVFTKPFDVYTSGIGLMKHPVRNCLYTEGDAVIRFGKAYSGNVKKLTEKYKNEGYPEGNGLYETSVLVRPRTDELNSRWWEEIRLCIRDQISLPYVLWKMGLKFDILDVNPFSNDYFYIKHHNTGKRLVAFL
jgi:hypothetical protein